MAHSYTDQDIAQLKLGQGEALYGDGALVVLKALLESGISYFGGYPGSPTANLMDAVADAYEPVLKDMGVYFETSSSEMSAGALLTTSVFGKVRGAVTWKVLGNGVAMDVVDHVSQLGVKDGAMIIVGEDYGVSSTTVVQRTITWGVKSGIIVVDPRGDQQLLHKMVKESMDLSRDSHSVVALLLRPQLSHTNAEIKVGDNIIPEISTVKPVEAFKKDSTLFPLPPYSQQQELDRYEFRLPTASRLVVERGLNEYFGGKEAEVGIITHGTTFNTTWRILERLGFVDANMELYSRIEILQLNVINPLNENQLSEFMRSKAAVLLVEEGQPELIEMQIRAILQRHQTDFVDFYAHDVIPGVGELLPERVFEPIAEFLNKYMPIETNLGKVAKAYVARGDFAKSLFPVKVTPRPPTFCTGCPERPVFSQMKINEMLTGKADWHAGDVGCYGMAGFQPFLMSDSNIGMGAGLAAGAGITALSKQKNVSVVGDGTLWHSAFNASAANAIYNKQDSTYIVLDNKWTAMTGAHENPNAGKLMNGENMNTNMSIKDTFFAMGVKKLEKANPYDFKEFQSKLKKIQRDSKIPQVRVLISEAECQLQKQRGVRANRQKLLENQQRVEVERFHIDDEVCVGDHACIRFNGCPSLTLKDSPNELRPSMNAYVDNTCVGCGVCGEVAQMAKLCPSFIRVTKIENPSLIERLSQWFKRKLVPTLCLDTKAVG
jgi:indolepyruvate ferredoxin oxidoreductase alpha subunit